MSGKDGLDKIFDTLEKSPIVRLSEKHRVDWHRKTYPLSRLPCCKLNAWKLPFNSSVQEYSLQEHQPATVECMVRSRTTGAWYYWDPIRQVAQWQPFV